MKKIFILLICLVGLLTFNVQAKTSLPEVTDHEKVTIYLFYASWCPHCHDFLEYFAEKYDDDYAKYFDIKAIRIDSAEDTEKNDPDNAAFADEVREALGVTETGIPLIVYGDKFQVGFGTDGQNIIDDVLKLYQDDSYVDKVSSVIEETEHNIKIADFEETLIANGLKRVEGSIPDWAIMTIIFVVLIGGIGGLFFLARKK